MMLQGNAGLKPKEGEITSRPWQWPINYKVSGRGASVHESAAGENSKVRMPGSLGSGEMVKLDSERDSDRKNLFPRALCDPKASRVAALSVETFERRENLKSSQSNLAECRMENSVSATLPPRQNMGCWLMAETLHSSCSPSTLAPPSSSEAPRLPSRRTASKPTVPRASSSATMQRSRIRFSRSPCDAMRSGARSTLQLSTSSADRNPEFGSLSC